MARGSLGWGPLASLVTLLHLVSSTCWIPYCSREVSGHAGLVGAAQLLLAVCPSGAGALELSVFLLGCPKGVVVGWQDWKEVPSLAFPSWILE